MVGELNQKILESFLETLPIEFSIVDANDMVLAWNKHQTRIFKRPTAVVGQNVRKCHPSKSLAMVEEILTEMKAGTRDKARFWIDMKVDSNEQTQKILIEYYALRDDEGNYLGCLEASQNITEVQQLTGQKRLLG